MGAADAQESLRGGCWDGERAKMTGRRCGDFCAGPEVCWCVRSGGGDLERVHCFEGRKEVSIGWNDHAARQIRRRGLQCRQEVRVECNSGCTIPECMMEDIACYELTLCSGIEEDDYAPERQRTIVLLEGGVMLLF